MLNPYFRDAGLGSSSLNVNYLHPSFGIPLYRRFYLFSSIYLYTFYISIYASIFVLDFDYAIIILFFKLFSLFLICLLAAMPLQHILIIYSFQYFAFWLDEMLQASLFKCAIMENFLLLPFHCIWIFSILGAQSRQRESIAMLNIKSFWNIQDTIQILAWLLLIWPWATYFFSFNLKNTICPFLV